MNQEEIMKTLQEINAIITDSHIVYTSGRHGSAYVNKDAVYPHTEITAKLCKVMAENFKDAGVDVVAGPTIGGVILSQWVAYYLSELTGKEVLGVFSEADENKNRFFKRGYDKIIPGKKILIVEDILTTGGSVKKVVEAVKAIDGEVVGVAAFCNRGGISAEDLGVGDLKSLISVDLQSWDEKECPLCQKGVAINTNVGKGREYLSKKQ